MIPINAFIDISFYLTINQILNFRLPILGR